MARPFTLTQTGVGSSPWFVLNPHISPFEVTLDCTISGTVTAYSIDVTNQSPLQTVPWDTVGGGSPTTPTVDVYNPTGFGSLSAAAVLYLNDPCFAIRVTIGTGTGTVKVEGIQAGIRGV
jgi:hypothetical protein